MSALLQAIPRYGFFGGSFDPPHIGHYFIAEKIIEESILEALYLVPTNQSPHKTSMGATQNHRLTMLQISAKDLSERVQVLDDETRRPPPSYTAHTVSHLLKKLQISKICLIIGADILESLPRWKDGEFLSEKVFLIVVPRAGYEAKIKIPENFAGHILDIQPPHLSSHKIREWIQRTGSPPSYGLLPSVSSYITKNKLYTK